MEARSVWERTRITQVSVGRIEMACANEAHSVWVPGSCPAACAMRPQRKSGTGGHQCRQGVPPAIWGTYYRNPPAGSAWYNSNQRQIVI